GDADPARAVFVLLALAVPEELHLHPAVLIDINLLATRPDDDRRLRPADDGPGRRPRRPERDAIGDAGGGVAVLRRLIAVGVRHVAGPVFDGRHDVLLAHLGLAVMVGERERAAGRKSAAGPSPAHDITRRLLLFHPQLRPLSSNILGAVAAGVVV